MRASWKSFVFTLSLALSLARCSDKGDKGSGGRDDSGTAGDGGLARDGSLGADGSAPVDAGPLPCLRDQGGAADRGCDSGEVCNLVTGQCVAGKSCANNGECDACTLLASDPVECGQGYHVVAYCDDRHGNVCTRSRAPCEPCGDDRDCGPTFLGDPQRCIEYSAGKKFCGSPCSPSCPTGFACDVDGFCRRQDGCPDEPTICPGGVPNQACSGTDQICHLEACPGSTGRCATNGIPGFLGICLNVCATNADCVNVAGKPVCDARTGSCITGCSPASCAETQACHANGFCAPKCATDADCENDPRYGPKTHCNIQNRPAPRMFKQDRDEFACVPLGCEGPKECTTQGTACDETLDPPACVPGCHLDTDCSAEDICRAGAQGSYDIAACRALPEKTDPNAIGVCCNPGCRDRVQDCPLSSYCCGEPGSPYENPSTCLPETSAGSTPVQICECFQMPAIPWCVTCDGSVPCDSGWTAGYNVDPNVNGGQPFQEQEFCVGISESVAVCTVTCNPREQDGDDDGCPRGWPCSAQWAPCLEDADCDQSGITCVGANPSSMPPRYGRCQCGTGGQVTAQCPSTNRVIEGVTIERPRCKAVGSSGDMFCVMSHTCDPRPPTPSSNYPATCGF